ncbi:hypothetical protein FF011L_21990 [Roseimaritima multifibrata]|uniref:Pterin-binding domain-containing protein n=1 Tax=Roseimaritima multifibrata TaxID=1930274 RepID=A0A517MEW9_9BACT|nr:DUF6513 domain-containing protein [Roseimaritima multifibrata]QDS93429.1 hypothetical protein FF011L_21990 [Roseimaritima multifibrata]
MSDSPSQQRHIHFITGKLAAPALKEVVVNLADEIGFAFTIDILPITVAALMTPKWIKRHWQIPSQATEIFVPGYIDQPEELQQATSVPISVGPKDLRMLPDSFGSDQSMLEDFGRYDIEILAEINHASRLPAEDLRKQVARLKSDGADWIDLGCSPGRRWDSVGSTVAMIRDIGIKVSIDTFDPWEAKEAARCGAELVLSVNASNRKQALDWGVEVVVVPDRPDDLDSLLQTIDFLATQNVPMRIDPILEPIGMGGPVRNGAPSGFTASLQRYSAVRKQFPEIEMMMGIGNLTELTDVDSAGVNVLLLGICQELGIRSVLTTEVINWARSSVRECDHGRRLVHHSVQHGIPPKRIDPSLVMLRDPKLRPHSDEMFASMAAQLKDNNYRLFAQQEQIHLLSAGLHLQAKDPFELFAELLQHQQSDNVDASHAFYLGYEMAKAMTALHLGKQYEQDEALSWGMLTQAEKTHRLSRASRHRSKPPSGKTNDRENQKTDP